MAESVALFAAGAVLLAVGSEAFVRGLDRLLRATSLKQSFLARAVPGLRGSVPAIAIIMSATLRGRPEIVLGTSIGAFVANLGLMLALTILSRPIAGRDPRLTVDFGLMAGAYFLLWFLCGDSVLNQNDGGVLLFAVVALWVYLFISSNPEAPNPPSTPNRLPLVFAALMAFAGLAGVIGGAESLVPATTELARAWKVREWVVSLTLVGAIASIPGLLAALQAARRDDPDAAFRITFGGNALILLLGLGLRGIMNDKPLGLSERVLLRELPLMGLFVLLVVPLVLSGFRSRRREGFVLLIAYGFYVVWQLS